jgi:hypothetical protein
MPRWLPHGARLVGLALVLAPLVGGCAKEATVVRVTGTVRSGGKAVPNLFLHFEPAEGRPSWGVTDAEGRYKLSYDRQREGAVRGRHTVFVEHRPRGPKEDLALQQGTLRPPPELQAILEKYGNRETSPLRYEITRDGQVIDLDLD